MIQTIGVIGAGQMGNGIAQVAACAGYDVVMIDIKDEYVEKGLGTIQFSLGKLVSKERMTQDDADAALARITTGTDRSLCADCDLVVEAVPEILSLKQEIFTELDSLCKPETIPGVQHLVHLHHHHRRFYKSTREGHRDALHEPGPHHETR